MLKYLFIASFLDGTVIEQTQEDKSSIDPEKRSQFFDVLEKEKEVPMVSFILVGEGHEYGVDMRDGHFEIDGVPFQFHEDTLTNLRLIFWRRHRHHFKAGSTEQIGHEVVYRFGWQATNHKGENEQHVMQID